MGIKYDLTAGEILRILELTASNREAAEIELKMAHREKELKAVFPHELKKFILLAYNLPLLNESDLFSNIDEIATLNSVFINGDDYGKQFYFGVDEDYKAEMSDNISDTNAFFQNNDDYLLIGGNINKKRYP